MLDLWPTDISYTRLKAPVTIIKEQAALLGEKTNHVVQAKIKRKEAKPEASDKMSVIFIYEFYITAPVLDDYSYSLFHISHDIELYPIDIYYNDDLKQENNLSEEEKLTATSESEFIEALRMIFSSKKTRRVIHAMLAQSVEVNSE